MAGLGNTGGGGGAGAIRGGKYTVEAGVDDRGIQSGLGRIQERFKAFSKKLQGFVPEGVLGRTLAKGAQGGAIGAGFTAANIILGPTIQKAKDDIQDALLNTRLVNSEMERMTDHWRNVAAASREVVQDRIAEAKLIPDEQKRLAFLQEQLKANQRIAGVLEQQRKGAQGQAGFTSGSKLTDYLGFGDTLRAAGASEVKNIGTALKEAAKDAEMFKKSIAAVRMEFVQANMKELKGFDDELEKIRQSSVDWFDQQEFEKMTEGWSAQAKEMEKVARQLDKLEAKLRNSSLLAKDPSQAKELEERRAAAEAEAKSVRQTIGSGSPFLNMALNAASAAAGLAQGGSQLKDAAMGAFATPFASQQFGNMGARKQEALTANIAKNTQGTVKALEDMKELMRFV